MAIGVSSPTEAAPEPTDTQAVIEEARRHQRRRRLLTALAALALLVGGLLAGFLVPTGPKAPSSTVASTVTFSNAPAGTEVVRFPGPFVPEQIVAQSDKVWVVGSTRTGGNTCAIESLDETTLASRFYPIPSCAVDVAAGDGRIFLATNGTPAGRSYGQVHIEVFNTTTGQATLLAPLVMDLFGSPLAHTALTYGDGSLWFYSIDSATSGVVQVSAATGAVVATFRGVSKEGGHFPTLVANSAGLWAAGGPGGGGDLWLFPSGSSRAKLVSNGGVDGAFLWLSAAGKVVWADAATYEYPGATVLTRLESFNASGERVVNSPVEDAGDMPLVAAGRSLWTVGVGARCVGPQHLMKVNSSTGRTTQVGVLKTPGEACLDELYASQLAATGGAVFVLDPSQAPKPASVLYRIPAH